MTYGLGMLLDDGLVMIADTRTNAGVDNISSYRKLHVLAAGDDRLVIAATAGNLSVTQTVLAMLKEGLPGKDGAPARTLDAVPSMFRAAQLVGEAMAAARNQLAPGLAADGIAPGVSMLLGGRIGDAPLDLYQLYETGNFIERPAEQPFLQIGEIKYGKPILDRSIRRDTPVDEATKIGLISFDSTMRSNLAVGPPLDLAFVPSDPDQPEVVRRIERDDPYFADLSRRWSRLLNEARAQIPPPPFLQ